MTAGVVRVYDPDLADVAEVGLPTGVALVRLAQAGGFDWVAITCWACDDDVLVVHPREDVHVRDQVVPLKSLRLHETRAALVDGERLSSLADVRRAARKAGLGLLVRIHTARTCAPLAESFGRRAKSPQDLRDRLLVVAQDTRVGKRLRADARMLPSGLELPGKPSWPGSWARRLMPNLARATADADHLLVPHHLYPRARVERLASALALRGAELWLTQIPAALDRPTSDRAISVPAPTATSTPATPPASPSVREVPEAQDVQGAALPIPTQVRGTLVRAALSSPSRP